jgi:hypothetical protein
MTTEKKKKLIAGILVAVALLLVGWQWFNYNLMQGRGAVAQRVSGWQRFVNADPATQERMATAAGEQMLNRMVGELGLNAQQHSQIRSIQAQSIAQMRVISENKSLSPEQKQEQLQQLRRDWVERINGVLTPEQQNRFAAQREKARQTLSKRLGVRPEDTPIP